VNRNADKRHTVDPRASQPPDNPFDVSTKERIVVLGSVLAAIITAVVLGLIYTGTKVLELAGWIVLSFFLAGKFLPLAALKPEVGYTAYELGFVIWIMDTVTVLVIVYSIELLYGVSIIRRGLNAIWVNANLVLTAYPRLRKLTIPGIVLFVLFPVAGTGAIGGAFIGILLGMHRAKLIFAVSFGGLLGGMAMAYAAENFREAVERLEHNKSNPVVLGVFIAISVTILIALRHMYKRALKRAEKAGLTKTAIWRKSKHGGDEA